MFPNWKNHLFWERDACLNINSGSESMSDIQIYRLVLRGIPRLDKKREFPKLLAWVGRVMRPKAVAGRATLAAATTPAAAAPATFLAAAPQLGASPPTGKSARCAHKWPSSLESLVRLPKKNQTWIHSFAWTWGQLWYVSQKPTYLPLTLQTGECLICIYQIHLFFAKYDWKRIHGNQHW